MFLAQDNLILKSLVINTLIQCNGKNRNNCQIKGNIFQLIVKYKLKNEM